MRKKVLEKEKAICMRKEGRSVGEIQKELKISKASASVWTRGIVSMEDTSKKIESFAKVNQVLATRAASEKSNELRKIFYRQGFEESKSASGLHLKGVMLYWAEGGKTSSTVKFSNTDPKMIKLFYEFLVKEMGIEKERLSVFFVYHGKEFEKSNLESEEIALFWSELLGVSRNRVKGYPNKNTRTSGKKKNRHLYGICTLQYSCVETFQRIMGAIEYHSLQQGAT